MKRVDRVLGFVLLGFGLVAAFESLRLGLERSGLPGSGLFPLLASSGIVLLAALQVVQSYRGPSEEAPAWPSGEGLRKTALFAVGLMIYVILAGNLGFFIATMLFLTALIRHPGGYGWRPALGISVALTLVLYLGLSRLLGVVLPGGIMAAVGL